MLPILVGAVSGLVVLWVLLVVALYLTGRREGDPVRLRDLLRLLPDVVRLVRGLAADRSLPRSVRIRLSLVLIYLVSPVDVVPDFIPVVGYADDAVVVALVLRAVVRAAGSEALDRHWPGTEEGLRVLKRVARVSV